MWLIWSVTLSHLIELTWVHAAHFVPVPDSKQLCYSSRCPFWHVKSYSFHIVLLLAIPTTIPARGMVPKPSECRVVVLHTGFKVDCVSTPVDITYHLWAMLITSPYTSAPITLIKLPFRDDWECFD